MHARTTQQYHHILKSKYRNLEIKFDNLIEPRA